MSVAASTNITGKGGDWKMEVGSICNTIIVNNYKYSLQDTCQEPDPSGLILQKGYAVITCLPGLDNMTIGIKDFGGLGALHDGGSHGLNWQTTPMVQGWTPSSFRGQTLMGLAIDRDTGDIYTSATRIWGGVGNANIYKIDGITGSVSLFATLPGTSLTVGYIDINPVHNVLFATNYDDGKIYRIDLNNGTILNTYDYLNAGTINGSAAPVNELVVGVGYNEMRNKLYYSLY